MILLAVPLVAIGCSGGGHHGGGGGGGGNPPTPYLGLLAGPGGGSGVLTISIASAAKDAPGKSGSSEIVEVTALQPVSGKLTMPGCQDDLVGSFDGTNLALQGTGACGMFNFSGVFNAGEIDGSCDGMGKHWIFALLPELAGAHVTAYCGHWAETQNGTPDGVTGTWDFLSDAGGALTGVAFNGAGNPYRFGGFISGTTVTIRHQGQQIGTGTISGTSVSGTYNLSAFGGGQGNWQGQVCE